MSATIHEIRPMLRPCYRCAYSSTRIPMTCIRLTGMPDCRTARMPTSLCGVRGVLWKAPLATIFPGAA